jgi:hypothetical protein
MADQAATEPRDDLYSLPLPILLQLLTVGIGNRLNQRKWHASIRPADRATLRSLLPTAICGFPNTTGSDWEDWCGCKLPGAPSHTSSSADRVSIYLPGSDSKYADKVVTFKAAMSGIEGYDDYDHVVIPILRAYILRSKEHDGGGGDSFYNVSRSKIAFVIKTYDSPDAAKMPKGKAGRGGSLSHLCDNYCSDSRHIKWEGEHSANMDRQRCLGVTIVYSLDQIFAVALCPHSGDVLEECCRKFKLIKLDDVLATAMEQYSKDKE